MNERCSYAPGGGIKPCSAAAVKEGLCRYHGSEETLAREKKQDLIDNTIRCWQQTRLLGVSASMSVAADADVDKLLLKAFDRIRGLVQCHNGTEGRAAGDESR